MELFYSKTSPFARKVLISAQVLGLDRQIKKTLVDVYQKDSSYSQIHPLNKVPSLRMIDGTMLSNSPFICEYLNSLSSGKKVIPSSPEKWRVLQIQSLADGIMEASVLRRMETLRAPHLRDFNFELRQKDKVEKSLCYFERSFFDFSQCDLRLISLLCALDYLEFRFPKENWLERFPQLKLIFEKHSSWEAMTSTSPLIP